MTYELFLCSVVNSRIDVFDRSRKKGVRVNEIRAFFF